MEMVYGLDKFIPFHHHPHRHSPSLLTGIRISHFIAKNCQKASYINFLIFAYLPSLPVFIFRVNGKITKILFFYSLPLLPFYPVYNKKSMTKYKLLPNIVFLFRFIIFSNFNSNNHYPCLPDFPIYPFLRMVKPNLILEICYFLINSHQLITQALL